MAPSPDPQEDPRVNERTPQTPRRQTREPNVAFRQLRGARSPGEFAAAVRRAAREIGEQVACDARYIGRVENGEIRCPNYAYERVFRHMFPGLTLADLGFSARETVRGRGRARFPPRPCSTSRPAPPIHATVRPAKVQAKAPAKAPANRRTASTSRSTPTRSTTAITRTTRRATCCVAHS